MVSPSRSPNHDQVKNRVLDIVISFDVIGEPGGEVVLDRGIGSGCKGVGAQIIAAEEGVALVEAALFAEMDIGDWVFAPVQDFAKLGGGQCQAGRHVVGGMRAAGQACGGKAGVVQVRKAGHGHLHINDVFGGQAGHGG